MLVAKPEKLHIFVTQEKTEINVKTLKFMMQNFVERKGYKRYKKIGERLNHFFKILYLEHTITSDRDTITSDRSKL